MFHDQAHTVINPLTNRLPCSGSRHTARKAGSHTGCAYEYASSCAPSAAGYADERARTFIGYREGPVPKTLAFRRA